MDKNAYLAQLQSLLPRGAAWTRQLSSNLTSVLGWAAAELARKEALAQRLLREADPRSTVDMLSDWEEAAGLPESCAGVPQLTYQERIEALVQRLTRIGGQSITYYLSVAESLGYTISVEEFRPFIAGHSCIGDPVGGGDVVRFYWRVTVPDAKIVYFSCGTAECGDSLSEIRRAELLECILNRLKPAHTILLFSYEGE